MQYRDKIANFIRESRRKKSLSQKELADLLGVNRNTVAMWERNEIEPGGRKLLELIEILDGDFRLLFSEEYLQKWDNKGDNIEKKVRDLERQMSVISKKMCLQFT